MTGRNRGPDRDAAPAPQRGPTPCEVTEREAIPATNGSKPGQVDHALALAEAGWQVFPCREGNKAPYTQHGHKDASTDPDQIREWWERWPNALIGAPIPELLLVLDIDPRNGGSYEALIRSIGPLPETLTVWSGRNDDGRHLYFHRPDVQTSGSRLPDGVDLKTDGYMIMPPSRHPVTHQPYRWETREPAHMPDLAVERLRAAEPHPVNVAMWPAVTATVTTPWGRGALDSECSAVASTPEGHRNLRLWQAGCNIGEGIAGGEIAEADAIADLTAAGQASGLEQDEITATLHRGLDKGRQHPRSSTDRTVHVLDTWPDTLTDGQESAATNGTAQPGR